MGRTVDNVRKRPLDVAPRNVVKLVVKDAKQRKAQEKRAAKKEKKEKGVQAREAKKKKNKAPPDIPRNSKNHSEVLKGFRNVCSNYRQ